jgi:hypothetical protein
VQLAARLVHGVNNTANATESIQVVFAKRKRISAFILSARKISSLQVYDRPRASVHRPLLV